MEELLQQLTLEEKAKLVCGKTFWNTYDIERLGVSSMMLTDGPHGLRKQAEGADHLGLNDSIVSVCFPAGCATGSSWDKQLMKDMGTMLGKIAKQENVNVLLGPAMNIKRSPLCGRNFEYISEDPVLAGELAAAYVQGVQSQNVGTSPKHFALNNQEYYRMTNSSNATQKTMREIYLRGFEKVVRQSHPYTMMAAYNKVNGVYACDSHELLQDILRKEWGFDGVVVSDWMASNNRVTNLEAGLDLSMPSTNGASEEAIVHAVQEGRLSEEALDTAVLNMLRLIERTQASTTESVTLDEAHAFAKYAADNSVVLLENKGILPLKPTQKVAFIGEFAKQPRYQGGGSSHINSYHVVSALEVAQQRGLDVTYLEGYSDAEISDKIDKLNKLIADTKDKDVIVFFAGLPDDYESEGYDRIHLSIPQEQRELILMLLSTGRKVVLVLHNGSPVQVPWPERHEAVLEVYLGGEAIGETTIDVLYGDVNPSGRLAETFPYTIEDTPAYGNFAADLENTEYQEGVFVGYRHYVTNDVEAQYDFGYGLSYTTFDYRDLTVEDYGEALTATVTVTNTGDYDGKEVVQLYVQKPGTSKHPLRELIAFDKVFVAKGDSVTVAVTIPKTDLTIWNTYTNGWQLLSGDYRFEIGKNVRDIVLDTTVTLTYTPTFSMDTTLGEINRYTPTKNLLDQFMAQHGNTMLDASDDGAMNDKILESFMAAMPIRGIISIMPGLKSEAVEELINQFNAAVRV